MKILIFILFPFFLFGTTYYLDNYAPDAGNGSINLPFNSLSRSLNVLQPGDTLILRGSNTDYGQIYFEDIDLPQAGYKNRRITVLNYRDEVVVISIKQDFKIDENYWNFSGIIFEDLKSGFSRLNFSGKNNNFYKCVFRTRSKSFFETAEQQNNRFKYCRIEN